MILRRARLRYPLAVEELIEGAIQPRTHALRTVYALLLSGLTLLIFSGRLSSSATPWDEYGALLAGRGATAFFSLYWLQWCGILIVLPAILAGALARERERDSLDLLLLAGLSPRRIVLEKYAARMASFVVLFGLSFPVLGASLAFGGVSEDQLLAASWRLLLTGFQVGAIALSASSDSARVSQAIPRAYFSVGAHLILFALVDLFLHVFDSRFLGVLLPGLYSFELAPSRNSMLFLESLVLTLPAMATIAWFLFQACRGLEAVVEEGPGHQPAPLPRFLHVPRKRFQRGPRFLPRSRPVAWREGTGSFAHFIHRSFKILALVVIFIGLVILVSRGGLQGEAMRLDSPFAVMLTVTWLLGGTAVALSAGFAFQRERNDRTLGVLLTLPISGAEIVDGSLVPTVLTARWVGALLALIVLLEAWARSMAPHDGVKPDGEILGYQFASALFILAQLRFLVWAGAWIGLVARDRGRILLWVFCGILGLAFLAPYGVEILLGLLTWLRGEETAALRILRLATPSGLFRLLEEWKEEGWIPGPLWLSAALHCGVYGGLGQLARSLCRGEADRLLGRIAGKGRPARAGPAPAS